MSLRLSKTLKISGYLCVIGSGILGYFTTDYLIAIFMSITGFLLIFLIPNRKRQRSNLTVHHFINVFTHFRVALESQANIYQSLVAALHGSDGHLYEELEKMVNAIGQNHTVTPYISFAKGFKHRFITHIMINIYMLVNHGTDSKHLWQFNYLFETLVKEHYEEQIALHESSYERFNMSLFLGTAVMMFTLMGSVMTMLGGF